MKMNFKYVSMMAVAAIMAGFTSCSSDDAPDNSGIVPNGEPTLAVFKLTQEVSGGTRALPTGEAIGDEKVVKNASVYIFGADGKYWDKATFTGTSTSAIEVMTGTNYFYVIANTRTKITDAINTIGLTKGSTTRAAFEKALITGIGGMADLLNSTDGYYDQCGRRYIIGTIG